MDVAEREVIARDAVLVRGVGLRSAVAINVISIIGIGPLITIPLVLGSLHGPLSLMGWILGALLALCDGLVWAELGSLYPGSGGTYGYLRNVFGRHRAGRLLAFLFVWQTIFVAPLNQATGYIGFANYTGYLFPQMAASPWMTKALAVGVGIVTLIALYRGITTISRIGLVLGLAAVLTLLCVIAASYVHFSPTRALTLPPHDSFWLGLRAGLGQALIIAMYDYLGYNQSSCIGGEVIDPARTIPRSIMISIGLVATLYVVMQFGVLGAIPWQSVIPKADGSLPPLGQHIASAIVEHSFGGPAAIGVTILILVTAFASVYGNLLGYSRVPFAAAADGVFLRPFAHVHPKQRFPDVSLVVMGLIALVACLFPLDQVINALTTGIVLIQSIAQIAALATIRWRGIRAPYRMWLYPIPAVIAFIGWMYLFASAGVHAIVFGIATLLAGAAVFAARAARAREWPFTRSRSA
ncbi:MAG: amino acid permease [Candidatus Eremiobacteraeota bacterium]|nr:amino acid permease [Candidatus Eremiobacteraeota bacterium]MBC5827510.1 amino acid permease [Candidatus Eremiobacteraeota bacterium]